MTENVNTDGADNGNEAAQEGWNFDGTTGAGGEIDANHETNTNGIPGSLPGESREETKARFRVTVDGEEMDVDEDELKKGYSHGKAASKKMEEAAALRNQANEVLRMFQENPKKMFAHFGIDPREFAAAIFHEDYEESTLSQEEKDMRKYKAHWEESESKRVAAEREFFEQQKQAAIDADVQSLTGQMVSALEAVGIPRGDPQSLGRMVAYMQAANKQGIVLSPSDIAPQVKKDYIESIHQLVGNANFEQLTELLGGETVSKIAKSTVKNRIPNIVPREANIDIKTNTDPFNRSGKKLTKDYFKR